MLGITRLPEAQQRNVGHALEEHFKSTPKPKYVEAVMKSGRALIAATAGLGESAGPTLFIIDRRTDTILAAILRIVQTYQKAFSSTIVAHNAAQQEMVEAAETVERIWFPEGLTFIHGSASDQNLAMTVMRKALEGDDTGPAMRAAIQTLGLGPLVEFFLAHAKVYARKLGVAGETATGEDSEPLDPSDVWHEAFVQFAIDVSSAYRDNPAVKQTLLGGYESQLAEYRAAQAKARGKEKAAAAEAEAKAKAEAEEKARAEAKPR